MWANVDTIRSASITIPKKIVKTKNALPETVPTDTERVASMEISAKEEKAVNLFTRKMKKTVI